MGGEPITIRPIERHRAGADVEAVEDRVAVEAPLEIRIDGRALAVTLRTPGHDRELALGFLAGEALIGAPADVAGLTLTPAACASPRTCGWTGRGSSATSPPPRRAACAAGPISNRCAGGSAR